VLMHQDLGDMPHQWLAAAHLVYLAERVSCTSGATPVEARLCVGRRGKAISRRRVEVTVVVRGVVWAMQRRGQGS